jgi:hypothetical protein
MSDDTVTSAVMVAEPLSQGQPLRSRNPFLDLLDAPTSHSLQGLLRRLGGLGSLGEDLLLSDSGARFGHIVRGLKPTAELSHQLQVPRPSRLALASSRPRGPLPPVVSTGVRTFAEPDRAV